MFVKVTEFSGNFGFLGGFSFAVFELFSAKIKTKNHSFSYNYMFYLFSMPKN